MKPLMRRPLWRAPGPSLVHRHPQHTISKAYAPRPRAPLQPLLLRRAQHDLPPHKEYFQHPGQNPLADATIYQPPLPVPPFARSERSYFVRALRSVMWAVLFGTLGVAAGAGAVTWEYLQPPFEPNSEEENEMQDEIWDMLENHPVVIGLREDGWVEEQFYYPPQPLHQQHGIALVDHKLTGTQGLTIKEFTLVDAAYTMFVCYVGNGVEGWPDVVHGGTIGTLFEEAFYRHVLKFYNDPQRWLGIENLHIDFKKPLRPGEIYTVMLPPASTYPATNPDTGEDATKIKCVALLMDMELAPQIEVENTSTEGSAITTVHKITIPSQKGDDKTHAHASSDYYSTPFSDAEGGSGEIQDESKD